MYGQVLSSHVRGVNTQLYHSIRNRPGETEENYVYYCVNPPLLCVCVRVRVCVCVCVCTGVLTVDEALIFVRRATSLIQGFTSCTYWLDHHHMTLPPIT